MVSAAWQHHASFSVLSVFMEAKPTRFLLWLSGSITSSNSDFRKYWIFNKVLVKSFLLLKLPTWRSFSWKLLTRGLAIDDSLCCFDFWQEVSERADYNKKLVFKIYPVLSDTEYSLTLSANVKSCNCGYKMFPGIKIIYDRKAGAQWNNGRARESILVKEIRKTR